ncbi:Putative peptidase M14, carboxypeptidase A, metallocarboxypeptidase-like, propeptide [Septoria linicola]|uniref:Peptidase M14, carboxypeptidase A, metallocarboxypeptidase-like, propeptide n=1 Tax=Septoria linicola TaxID=215465 RepID=A0A9Q9ELX6_9PEZI|nr:putative peptidase M14, carboxypeptidase A, metallocarboxypeptidase-like, propeptide [Septoria linicola]USW56236.1 Putative peptidase M14, carboxypeptidase A, metallocarboxypeptidase-like, propeptide [Septoria linicola]
MFILRLLSLAPLALASVLPREEAVSYDGYRVYRIATAGDDASVLEKLSALNFEQWNLRTADHVDISIAPDAIEQFEALGLNYKTMHADLGADIAKEAAGLTTVSRRQAGAQGPESTWFNAYHSYAEHVQYWRDMVAGFPRNSQRFTAGTSFQNREIFGVKLFGNNTGTQKSALVWHGTVHAREWISTMTVEFLAASIVAGYKRGDPAYTSILDKFDLYILPVVNPDGFVYSQTTDRLWRKNRAPGPNLTGRLCYGTDINRNWPYQWTGDPNGASTDPCAQTYKGRSAGDTPENKALVAQLKSVSDRQNIAQYLDFHSYGNYLLSPYGYTANVPANSATQVNLANRAAAAIRAVYGTQYTTGPSGATLYPTTGSSVDYAFDIAGADYAYTFELRDKGERGFVLPPAQIRPTGEEVLAGVRVLLAGI